MGWWSEDLMGGDTPYDIVGEFEMLTGVDWLTLDLKQVVQPKVEITQDLIDQIIKYHSGGGVIDGDVLLATAVVLTAFGYQFPPEFRKRIIDTRQWADVECWSDPATRQAYINHFVEWFENEYTNEDPKPYNPKHEGLLTKIQQM